ncbi:hypothetical protein BsWGS_15181 [Bradybaena similaris]
MSTLSSQADLCHYRTTLHCPWLDKFLGEHILLQHRPAGDRADPSSISSTWGPRAWFYFCSHLHAHLHGCLPK